MSKRAWRLSQGGTRPATVSTEPQGTGPEAVAFRWLMPAGVGREAAPLLVGRGLRALADGYMAVLLPAYLLALGNDPLQVGVIRSEEHTSELQSPLKLV